MIEMQLVMGVNELRGLAKERWVSQVPGIIEQAKVEAPHKTRLSHVIHDWDSEGTYIRI